jgi:hypothetical protein
VLTRGVRPLIGVALVGLTACGSGNGPTSPTPAAVVLSVQSEGTISHSAVYGGGQTTFSRSGQTLFAKTGGGGGARGFTIATLDVSAAQLLSPATNYDTYGDASRKVALAAFLDALPDGQIGLIGVADDAGFQQSAGTSTLIAALQKRGCTKVREYGYRDSYACIFLTGETTPKAEGFSESAAVTIQWTVNK